MRPRRDSRRTFHRFAALVAAFAVAVPSVAAPQPAAADGAAVAGRVRASPVVVAFDLASSSTAAGQPVRAEARVTNLSAATQRSISVELRADRAGLSVKSASTSIAQLKPGRSTTVAWSLCGAAAGSYVLLVRVTIDGASIDSDARLLTVLPGRRRCA